MAISRNCRANSEKIAELRGRLARFISGFFLNVGISSFICWLIFRYSPGLKHRNIHDLPIWKWFWVLGVICFFGCCSMVVGANRYLNRRFRNLTGLASSGFILLGVLWVIREQPTILGLQASNWLLVILLVLLDHNAIRILTSLAAAWLRIHYQKNNDPSGGRPSQKRQPRKIDDDLVAVIRVILSYLLPIKETREWRRLHVVYFAQGLSRSINFLLTSLLFLLTWILYFGSRLNRTSASIREAYDYVTRTLICIFIISICWLVKDAIVLSWASRVVYDRFHVEISQRSTQLWLLGILGGREFDILGIHWNDRHEAQGEVIRLLQLFKNALIGATIGQRLRPDEEARQVLVPSAGQKDRLPIHNIEGTAEYFLAAEGSLSEKSYVSDFCKKWDLINGRSNIHDNKPPIMDLDEKEIEGETVKVLRSEIQNNAFDNWIKKAHKSSLDLARSLSGAKEGVDSLNQIIAWLIIGVAIVIWLTATRIATLKEILLNVSPVLTAASFIFRDTCKNFIQGFMFAYVRHPLTVGDRCIVTGSTEKKAHKSSLDLARSLSGAKEVVDSLNQIIAWLRIIVVAIVIWLPATGKATTKVTTLIASPVLAVSFTFGDICKTFCEGFMFAYLHHPFTVGDSCTINDSTEIMRVMRIGIWNTIFSKTSSKVEVIYPNSVLGSSAINKLKGIDPDHDDEVSYAESCGGVGR